MVTLWMDCLVTRRHSRQHTKHVDSERWFVCSCVRVFVCSCVRVFVCSRVRVFVCSCVRVFVVVVVAFRVVLVVVLALECAFAFVFAFVVIEFGSRWYGAHIVRVAFASL